MEIIEYYKVPYGNKIFIFIMRVQLGSSSSHSSPKWQQPKCLSVDEWINKSGMSIQWNILQPQKE